MSRSTFGSSDSRAARPCSSEAALLAAFSGAEVSRSTLGLLGGQALLCLRRRTAPAGGYGLRVAQRLLEGVADGPAGAR